MKILFVNWKDINHPQSGGAEVVLWQILKRLVQNGYQVSLLTVVYQKNGIESPEVDEIDGIKIFRVGKNKFLHSVQANLYYQKKLKNEFDLVVEMVNTAPYFIGFNILWNNFWQNLKYKIQNKFTKKSNKNQTFEKPENGKLEKKNDRDENYKIKENLQNMESNYLKNSPKNTKFALFYHQLAREIWWLETKIPINFIGFYLLEPIATFIQSRLGCKTITVSESSKNDLARFGFDKEKIAIISEGIDNEPLENLGRQLPKDDIFTVLYHGSLRAMKRPIEVLKSFEKLTKLIQNWQNENPKLAQKIQNNLIEKINKIEKMNEKTEQNSNQNTFKENKDLQKQNLQSDLTNQKQSKLEINIKNKTEIENQPKVETNAQIQQKVVTVKKEETNFIPNSQNSSQIPCQLWISGGGQLLEECQIFCRGEKITNFTTFFGRTSDEQKLALMQKSTVLVATSLKEGWGLIVTEGNSMGTPAVVYDVDGLRDSGSLAGNFVVEASSTAMANQLFELWKIWYFEKEKYVEICTQALKTSKKITFEQCYEDFEKIITN